MKTCLAAIGAIIAVALVIPHSVNAGASASAPSKYAQTNRSSQQQRQAGRHNYPITEYSSSARRNPQR
jgi:hypothetical protein